MCVKENSKFKKKKENYDFGFGCVINDGLTEKLGWPACDSCGITNINIC